MGDKCTHVRMSNVVPGWACCKCRMYNGYQRHECRGCGHVPCYETESNQGKEALELMKIGHDPDKVADWIHRKSRSFVFLAPGISAEEHQAGIERLLADWHSVYLAVKPCPGLVLPERVMPTEGTCAVLLYGIDFAVNPIPDLVVGPDGIRATLSFDREPCQTFVPWGAVAGFSMEGQRPKQRNHLRSV